MGPRLPPTPRRSVLPTIARRLTCINDRNRGLGMSDLSQRIAKAGISLASELRQGFGGQSPNQVTVAQPSQLIDSLKQCLTPSPV